MIRSQWTRKRQPVIQPIEETEWTVTSDRGAAGRTYCTEGTRRMSWLERLAVSVLVMAGAGLLAFWLIEILQMGNPIILTILCVAASVVFMEQLSRWFLATTSLRRSLMGYFLLTIGLLEVVGWTNALAIQFQGQNSNAMRFCLEPPGELKLIADHSAVTDSGVVVGLYRREVEAEKFEAFLATARTTLRSVTELAILRADARHDSNCHGWVFAEGRYIVRNEDVPIILSENGYSQTDTPGINDVVVYYDTDGSVLHTAIVRALYDGQLPLVEGKWGPTSVYLHMVDQQPYSSRYSYWRTSRCSHALAIRSGKPEQLEYAASEIATQNPL